MKRENVNGKRPGEKLKRGEVGRLINGKARIRGKVCGIRWRVKLKRGKVWEYMNVVTGIGKREVGQREVLPGI